MGQLNATAIAPVTVSKAKTFRNVLYTFLTKGATVACQLVASFVVARNLSPADYGLVGFAFIIIGFISRFGDLGIGNAVICRPKIDNQNLWTAFTLKLILSTAAFLIAFFVAPFAHHFFEHPATADVIRLLSLNVLLTVIGFLPQLILIREMNYRALVFPGVLAAIVRCVLIVVLILHGWRYWAIIVADVASTLASAVTMQAMRRIPVRLYLDWPDADQYLRFGMPLLGTGLMAFAIFNLDNFLVGARLGAKQLGYYALAFMWASFICMLLNDTVNSVLLPTLSAIQSNREAMRRWYLKALDLVSFVAIVGNTSLLVNTHWFLAFMGKNTGKWEPAEVSLKILCVYGILRAMIEPIGPCVTARGHTKVMWHASFLAGSIELALLLLVLRTGKIELVALAVLIAYVSQGFVYLPYLRREFSIGLRELAMQLWPALPAIAAGYLVTLVLPVSFGSSLLTLAARGFFTASVVAITHGLFTRFRCFYEASGMISQNFARARA